jgi:hypothetical protein
MLDQLIAAVSQRTGMPPDKARAAVDAVISQLKAHLPSPIANHIDGLLAGTTPSANPAAAGGFVGDMESRAKDMLGGMLR